MFRVVFCYSGFMVVGVKRKLFSCLGRGRFISSWLNFLVKKVFLLDNNKIINKYLFI